MDSPAVKRQKTDGGFNASAVGYDSDADDGDNLFDGYIPDTPLGKWETQPTQILDKGTGGVLSSPIAEKKNIVQVPASSPFSGRDDTQKSVSSPHFPIKAKQSISPSPKHTQRLPPGLMRPQQYGAPRQAQLGVATKPLAMSMAPAGTAYRPPNGITTKPPNPTKTVIEIDSDDDGPTNGGDSSDDDQVDSASIRPTTFASKPAPLSKTQFTSLVHSMEYKGPEKSNGAASSSFGNRNQISRITGAAIPQAPANFQPRQNTNSHGYPLNNQAQPLGRKPQLQTRPERAQPVVDVSWHELPEQERAAVARLQAIFPFATVLTTRNALLRANWNFEDAATILADSKAASDDELPDVVDLTKKPEPQMKRVLNAPIASLRDKYSHTYNKAAPSASSSQQQPVANPPRPKKRLVQGRRHPSSPAGPADSSPLKPSSPVELTDYETDSGVASAEEEDPLLEGRFLKWLNECSVDDLVELTSQTKENAELMIAARPFRNLGSAELVAAPLKSGKKSTKAPIGEKMVEKGLEMFAGYEAIDALVAKCEQLGKPLAAEMGKWGFDVFGAAKDGAGLGVVSLDEDDKDSRDSGFGSPTSATISLSGDNGDDEIKTATSRRKSKDVNFLKQPAMMSEDIVLKDYQVVGLNWLSLMYRQKLSCILADDMGLGKTCQVISFLTHLVETGRNGPHIVVLPGSVLENWLREFQRFSPKLVVEPYHGSQKDRAEMADRILEHRDEINVVVSTYELVVKKDDNKFMRKLRPDVAVFDEGHLLKNPLSQRFQGINKIPTNFRLLLTGTPLQNNLQELATLLSFILPDIFSEKAEEMEHIFKHKVQVRDTDHGALLSAQRIARARSMLTPFVLRRKKAQVLKHLPGKVLRVQYCDLEAAQKEIYDGHIEEAKERARARLTKAKIPKNENQENNPLMQLRKAAIHPLLFRRHFTNAKIEKMADILRKSDQVNFPTSAARHHLIKEMQSGSDFWLHNWCNLYPSIKKFDTPDLAWMNSGKVSALVDLVQGYKKNGDRVLIFSQFSLVLDILEAVLNTSEVAYTRIDGSTKIDERQTLIDNFRDDSEITAFLLTTKAGGVGLNLAYANKVIIFDGSFNPQDDRQAENRAHRVGQTREVEVVRLVTKGTVEEAIFSLGKSKLLLDGRVAGDDDESAAGVDDEEGEAKGMEAVNRMLLEGIGSTESESPKDGEKDKDAKQGSKARISPRKASVSSKAPPKGAAPDSRKRSSKGSMLSTMLSQEVIEVDEDGEEMLV